MGKTEALLDPHPAFRIGKRTPNGLPHIPYYIILKTIQGSPELEGFGMPFPPLEQRLSTLIHYVRDRVGEVVAEEINQTVSTRKNAIWPRAEWDWGFGLGKSDYLP